ncbi:hypothetical protein AX14_010043, partial [Amanita brunnescens Koide BX004]
EDEHLKCFDTFAVSSDPSFSTASASTISSTSTKPPRNNGKKAKKSVARPDNMTVD